MMISREPYNHDKNKQIIIKLQSTESDDVIETAINSDNMLDLNIKKQHVDKTMNATNLTQSSQTDFNFVLDVIKKIQYIAPIRKSILYNDLVQHDKYSKSDRTIKNIESDGSNIIEFLIQRWFEHDPNWNLFEEYLVKIDPKISLIKTPLNGDRISATTKRKDGKNNIEVNLSMQGNGIQNAIILMSAIIFSPQNSTIIIEEPENHLHSKSVDVLVDLFNYAINKLDKQIIITTHSWDVVQCYCSDVGLGMSRGDNHEKIDAKDFKMLVFRDVLGEEKIQDYDITTKKPTDIGNDFKKLWG